MDAYDLWFRTYNYAYNYCCYYFSLFVKQLLTNQLAKKPTNPTMVLA